MQRGHLVRMNCQNDLTGCRLSADTVAARSDYEDQLHLAQGRFLNCLKLS
jgi:hypothetical protein